jgi:hypothetical protein
MGVPQGYVIALQLAVHLRFDPWAHYAVHKKDAMNTAITITPTPIANPSEKRVARLCFRRRDTEVSGSPAEICGESIGCSSIIGLKPRDCHTVFGNRVQQVNLVHLIRGDIRRPCTPLWSAPSSASDSPHTSHRPGRIRHPGSA